MHTVCMTCKLVNWVTRTIAVLTILLSSLFSYFLKPWRSTTIGGLNIEDKLEVKLKSVITICILGY